DVEYVLGDMRSLPWRDRFDAAFLWYSTFGYFDEADNERVLYEAAASLRKGGRLLIDQINRYSLLRKQSPSYAILQRDDDLRIDTDNNDPLTDRLNCERIVVRGGSVRRMRLSVRQYGYSECVRMLQSAGLDSVEVYGQEGAEFTPYGPRLVVIAYK
ncbi:class I SAM-dependent methyltransferase, partial [Mesorhizobium ciceri]